MIPRIAAMSNIKEKNIFTVLQLDDVLRNCLFMLFYRYGVPSVVPARGAGL